MLTKELIGQVVNTTKLTKKNAEQLLATTTAIMRENLLAGKAVQLQGIGSLEMKERKARTIVHPRTGERSIAPSKNQLVFKPVGNLKDELKKI
ncbi:MAG: HU family DNA-binding protein [Paludibacteraceae bacterium]|nr:HU family DNA-binding protein [Paludibacteraceae bacterium]